MLNRSQLLLQQLGIQSWIPKQSVVEKRDYDQLWRDQSAISFPIIQAIESKVQTQSTENQAHPVSDIKVIATETMLQAPHLAQESAQDQGNINLNQSIITASPDIVMTHTRHDISFQYDVLVHEKFLIFADIIHDAERKLFINIQKACFALSTQLRWPLQIKDWNSSDQFAESYVQGFLAVHSVKDIIVLGDMHLPITERSGLNIHVHASLFAMLESAQHKRNLWNMLYPLINDDE